MNEGEMIERVRSFNRTVTERVGALSDHYLARDRPLGEARVLWEIGETGRDVRTLRARLGLDSGYLSRLLRSLEAAGLITVAVSAQDRRVRVAELTTKGRKERGLLNRRSNKLAQSMLAPLTATDRDRLVTAMSEVNRILTSTMIHIEPIDPAHRLAQYCLANYLAELDHRFETGFDPAQSLPCEPDDLRPPNGLLLMASLYGEAVGCGALKVNEARPTEIKRMWVSPDARGMGIGRRMLEALEQHAEDFPSRVLHLETNRNLFEAISLYRSAGYKEVDAFNNEQYAHHWFEKHL